MSKIKTWYRNLSDQWKAALRTAVQTAGGLVGVFVLAVFAEAVDILNGGTLDQALADVSNAGRVLLIGIIGVASGIVSFAMNRPDGARSAHYSRTLPLDEH